MKGKNMNTFSAHAMCPECHFYLTGHYVRVKISLPYSPGYGLCRITVALYFAPLSPPIYRE
jgi:hypothetical protein